MEGEAGERADAVSDVEGEGVGALVRHGLDVVEAALVDDRLVEHGDLRALLFETHMPDSFQRPPSSQLLCFVMTVG